MSAGQYYVNGPAPYQVSKQEGVRQFITNLTDAQIKALPTTAVDLTPAPETGYRWKPIAGTFSINNGGGVYTNINATYASMQCISVDGLWLSLAAWNDSVYGLTEVSDLFNNPVGRKFRDFQFPYLDTIDNAPAVLGTGEYIRQNSSGNPYGSANAESQKIQLAVDNNGGGNFTGGNAANVGRVHLYCWLEQLAP